MTSIPPLQQKSAYDPITSTDWNNITAALTSQLSYGATDTGWISASLVNSWTVNVGSGSATPGYRKIGNTVYLRGTIQGGASGSACWTMASAYLSASNIYLAAVAGVSSFPGAAGLYVQISPAGTVAPQYGSGTLSYFSLDGLSYLVD